MDAEKKINEIKERFYRNAEGFWQGVYEGEDVGFLLDEYDRLTKEAGVRKDTNEIKNKETKDGAK
jgi:hypothetical protein